MGKNLVSLFRLEYEQTVRELDSKQSLVTLRVEGL